MREDRNGQNWDGLGHRVDNRYGTAVGLDRFIAVMGKCRKSYVIR